MLLVTPTHLNRAGSGPTCIHLRVRKNTSAVKEGTDEAGVPGAVGPWSHTPGAPLTTVLVVVVVLLLPVLVPPPLLDEAPLLVDAPLLVLLVLRAERKESAAEATLWPRSPVAGRQGGCRHNG
jgi:hypothetical protein